ncbi:hypothetical protein HK096_010259 [Nowakowskiella sp. JEL0078]|nr:hypothetical protein HK096_010259 [Nowakowskiella sp. JEL0078]
MGLGFLFNRRNSAKLPATPTSPPEVERDIPQGADSIHKKKYQPYNLSPLSASPNTISYSLSPEHNSDTMVTDRKYTIKNCETFSKDQIQFADLKTSVETMSVFDLQDADSFLPQAELPPELAAITVNGPIRVGKSKKNALEITSKNENLTKFNSKNPNGELRVIQILDVVPSMPITSICLSEERIFAGSKDGMINEWDLLSGSHIRTLKGHEKAVTCLAAGSGILYSGSEDGSLRFWVIATGSAMKNVLAHDGYVTSVCVTAEGKLYTGGADRIINSWDPITARRLWVLSGHSRWILALSSADGRLYSGGSDNTIRVWDIETGRCLMTLNSHKDWVYSIAIAPQSNSFYSSCRDGTIKVWDINGECITTLQGHGNHGVRSVAVAPSVPNKFYSAGDDKSIIEWDSRTGAKISMVTGHTGAVSSLIFTANGLLFSGSEDCTVRIWDAGQSVTERKVSLTEFGVPQSQHISTERNPPPTPLRPYGSLLMNSNIDDIADTDTLRSQLIRTQESLIKNNRTKLRLKEDLAELHLELAITRSELADAQKGLKRLKILENEREQMYKSRTEQEHTRKNLEMELELLRDQYEKDLEILITSNDVLSNYVQKSADRQFLSIEVDVATIRELLDHPHTPLNYHKHNSSLAEFFYPQAWSRTWEVDSDWDSDVEFDNDEAWWRKENPYDVLNMVVQEKSLTPKLDSLPDQLNEIQTPKFDRNNYSTQSPARPKYELPPYEPIFNESQNAASSAATVITTARILSTTMLNQQQQQSSENQISQSQFGSGNWLKPLRNLVESTLEQFAPPIPPNAKSNLDRERELREQKDQELRDVVEREARAIEAMHIDSKPPRVKSNRISSISEADKQRREREKEDFALRESMARSAELAEAEATAARKGRSIRPTERELREIKDRELRESVASVAAELESYTKTSIKGPSVSGGSVVDLTLRDSESVVSGSRKGTRRADDDNISRSSKRDDDNRSMRSGFSATGVGVRAGQRASINGMIGMGGISMIGMMNSVTPTTKAIIVDNKLVKVSGLVAEALPELDEMVFDDIDFKDPDLDLDTPVLHSWSFKQSIAPFGDVYMPQSSPVGRLQSVNALVAPSLLFPNIMEEMQTYLSKSEQSDDFSSNIKKETTSQVHHSDHSVSPGVCKDITVDSKHLTGEIEAHIDSALKNPYSVEENEFYSNSTKLQNFGLKLTKSENTFDSTDEKLFGEIKGPLQRQNNQTQYSLPAQGTKMIHPINNLSKPSATQIQIVNEIPEDDSGSTLERIATVFESAIENAIENPWGLLPSWLRSSKVTSIKVENIESHVSDPEIPKLIPYNIESTPSKTTHSRRSTQIDPYYSKKMMLTPADNDDQRLSFFGSANSISQVFASAFEVVPPVSTKVTSKDLSKVFDINGFESETLKQPNIESTFALYSSVRRNSDEISSPQDSAVELKPHLEHESMIEETKIEFCVSGLNSNLDN